MPEDNASRVMALADPGLWRGIPYGLPPVPNVVDVEPNSARQSIDCSLYVLAVFDQAGIPITGARTAEQIRRVIPTVVATEDGQGWGNVKSGDLLFFEQTYDAGERATHIGISHGSGTHRMFDANSSRNPTVGTTNLGTDYWQTRIFEARRPKSLIGEQPAPGPMPGVPVKSATLDRLHRIRWEGMGVGYNPLTGIAAFWREHAELGAAVSAEVTLEDGRQAQAFAGGIVVAGPNGPRIL